MLFVNALSLENTGYRNTTYAFNRNGELVGKYFKKHLPPLEKDVLKLDRNYTLYGGPYDNGGLFGCVGDGAVVKNVAIVNAEVKGDRKGVFAKEIRNCTLENILVDVTSVSLSNGGALGSLLSKVTLRNVVVYYPDDATATNGAFANYVDVTAENVYVISNKGTSGSTNTIAGTLVSKAGGTVCSEVGFTGFGDNWVLTGNKAIFVSTQEFLD